MYEVSYDIRELIAELRRDVRDVEARVAQIEGWRWRVVGGLGVASLFLAVATALFVYVVTGQ